jgi:hypothetical protein
MRPNPSLSSNVTFFQAEIFVPYYYQITTLCRCRRYIGVEDGLTMGNGTVLPEMLLLGFSIGMQYFKPKSSYPTGKNRVQIFGLTYKSNHSENIIVLRKINLFPPPSHRKGGDFYG